MCAVVMLSSFSSVLVFLNVAGERGVVLEGGAERDRDWGGGGLGREEGGRDKVVQGIVTGWGGWGRYGRDKVVQGEGFQSEVYWKEKFCSEEQD